MSENVFKYVNGKFVMTEGYGSVKRSKEELDEKNKGEKMRAAGGMSPDTAARFDKAQATGATKPVAAGHNSAIQGGKTGDKGPGPAKVPAAKPAAPAAAPAAANAAPADDDEDDSPLAASARGQAPDNQPDYSDFAGEAPGNKQSRTSVAGEQEDDDEAPTAPGAPSDDDSGYDADEGGGKIGDSREQDDDSYEEADGQPSPEVEQALNNMDDELAQRVRAEFDNLSDEEEGEVEKTAEENPDELEAMLNDKFGGEGGEGDLASQIGADTPLGAAYGAGLKDLGALEGILNGIKAWSGENGLPVDEKSLGNLEPLKSGGSAEAGEGEEEAAPAVAAESKYFYPRQGKKFIRHPSLLPFGGYRR